MSGSAPLPEKGLGLALEILEQVARHHAGMAAADIARELQAPRATVYRIVNALVRDEYLVRRPDLSGFLLGTRVLELASIVDAHRRPPYQGILDRLRAQTGEAVHLVGFHRAGLTVIDEDPVHPLSDRAALLEDPTRSAVGHLWLIERPERPPSPRDARWGVPTGRIDVADISAAVAARGYAEHMGMLAPDRGCLAVPIRSNAEPVGAVSLSTSISRLSLAARHVAALREAAESLAALELLPSR